MLRNIVKIAFVLSGLMVAVFACDILLWTVALNCLSPWDSLVRLGVWLVPLSLLFYYLYRTQEVPQ